MEDSIMRAIKDGYTREELVFFLEDNNEDPSNYSDIIDNPQVYDYIQSDYFNVDNFINRSNR